MTRGLPGRTPSGPATTALAAVLLLVAVGACAARPGPVDSSAASGPRAAAHPGGALFSTISCAATPLGREWSRLRGEAETRFPGLKLTRVDDLHITVVYVGEGWQVEDLETIRSHALAGPRQPLSLRPEVVRMGRNGSVVAVETHGAPGPWTSAVIAAKAELNRLGLKKADRYDTTFRPHVTLASVETSPPDDAGIAALEGFRTWLAEKVASDESRFTVTVGADTPVLLWLAGTARPPGSSSYVDLSDVLPRP